MTETGKDRSARGTAARAWWARWCGPERGDPATRAQLRRCRRNGEALLVPAALQLARQLGVRSADSPALASALGLARVLAFVRSDTPTPVMRQAGFRIFPGDAHRDSTQPPRLSEVRFRRLLLAEPGEELVSAFIRLLRLVDGEVAVARLAADFLAWDNERVRQRWAFEYYAADGATPSDLQTTETGA